MIDVQRDWHFQTYLQGIRKMKALINSGDDDTANYRELAGLSSFTGQYSQAADYLAAAIERTPEADSRLFEQVELVHHYLDADNHDQARAVVERILTDDLPAVREQLGPAVVQFGLRLASTINEHAPDLALRVLSETTTSELSDWHSSLGDWLLTNFDERTWNNHPQFHQLRRMLSWHAGTVINTLHHHGLETTLADDGEHLRLAEHWLSAIAFFDADDSGDILGRYASAASYYRAIIGDDRFDALLATAAPAPEDYDHTRRHAGLAQLSADLSWIRISPQYWAGRLHETVNEKQQLSSEAIAALRAGLDHAITTVTERDMETAFLERQIHNARLIGAILGEDEDALRLLMQAVADKDDKRMRDDTAMLLGDCAPLTSAKWWQRCLQAWQEELDYKPKYYWIAWRAALADAPTHGLAAAKLAAERFSDDASFVEEYQFMRKLFETSPAP
jgi:hypothetical protein